MKPTVRIRFCDFTRKFNVRDNYFTQLLGECFHVEISDEPDFLIYSCFGDEFRRHQGIRIYYTAENRRPNFTECDYAFSFDFCDHPNHMRLPFWRFRYPEYALSMRSALEPQDTLRTKKRFCNFVYSNHLCPTRNRFFRLLSKYKPIDSAGKLFNNVGEAIAPGISNKLNFIQQYKFTIAFENESYPGYTTEKLYEALFANTLPIYWGNPRVGVDFNPGSFLSFYDYGNLNALIEMVIEVDQNDELYYHYLRQPRFPANSVNDVDFRQQLLDRFDQIFRSDKRPVAQQPKPARYFIVHPAKLIAARIKKKSLRMARKYSYRRNLRQLQGDSIRK